MDHANLGPLEYAISGEPASFKLLSQFEKKVRDLLDNSSSDYIDSQINYELGIDGDVMRFSHRTHEADQDTEEACSWAETTMEVTLSNANSATLKVVYGTAFEPISIVPSCDEDMPLVLAFIIEAQKRNEEALGRELTANEYELLDLLKQIACDIITNQNPYVSARRTILNDEDTPTPAAIILRDEIEVQSEPTIITEGYRFEVENQDSVLQIERRWIDGNFDPHDPEIADAAVLSVELETSDQSDPYDYEILFDGTQYLRDYQLDIVDPDLEDDFEEDLEIFRNTLGIGVPDKNTIAMMQQAIDNAHRTEEA